MAKTTLNGEGDSAAHALIRAGHYDMASPWSFDAADGDKLLGPNGDDWDKFGRWHLGEDPSEPREAKAHWKYPYGKDGKVYRRALAAIRSRASQQGDTTIFDAAGKLMSAMDEEEDKKEGLMTTPQHSARFSHFLAAREGETEDARKEREARERGANEKETGKRETDEERAKREAEEEDEAKKARERSRRGKGKGKKARQGEKDDDDDEDGDDAADDDEDEDDDEEMKKARAADHGPALAAAFRKGARSQRRRCAAIFACKAAAANPALALSLAFETTTSAKSAIAILERTPAPARAYGLHERMAGSAAALARVGAGDVQPPTGAAAIAKGWDAALSAFAPPVAAR